MRQALNQLVVAATLMLILARSANAASSGTIPFVSNPNGGSSFVFANYTLGSSFTVGGQGLFVTALGYWDAGNDGLLESHGVALWNSNHAMIAFATIPSGTSTTLTNGFRWLDLTTPVALLPNTRYTLGGFTGVQPVGGDAIQYAPATYTIDTRFTFNNATLQPSPGGLQEPTLVGDFALGPNLMAAASVPEPSVVSLSIVCLAAIMTMRFARHQSSRA